MKTLSHFMTKDNDGNLSEVVEIVDKEARLRLSILEAGGGTGGGGGSEDPTAAGMYAAQAQEAATAAAASATGANTAKTAAANSATAAAASITGGTPDYIVAEAERVAAAALSVRTGQSLTFAAFSDAHVACTAKTAESVTAAGQGLACIRKIMNLDMVAHMGDYINGASGSTKAGSLEEYRFYHRAMYEGCNGIPTAWLKGNHDANIQGGDSFTFSELYGLIGANNQGEHVVEYGNEERLYGYIDFTAKRLRVIYLNSSDANAKTGTSADQAAWLAGSAFDFSGKDDAAEWGIVILTHIPPTFSDSASIMAAINAYAGEAELIAIFHGHCHNFRAEQVGAAGVWQIGIPELVVGRNNEYASYTADQWNDFPNIFGELDENGDPIYTPKTSGTAECTSFNVVTIDRMNRKIYCHAFGAGGAGRDREFTYTSGKPAYTNLFDATAEGFLDNVRLSDSSGTGSMTGSWLSNYIAVSDGDIIRMRQPNGTSFTSYTRALAEILDSSKVRDMTTYPAGSDGQLVLDADGLGYTLTIARTKAAFVRCVGYGSREGVIITKNEPIV